MHAIATHRWLLVAGLAAVCAAPLGCQARSESGVVADATSVTTIREALLGEGGGAAAADKPQGTGWATLKGTFTFEGDPPEMPAYDAMSKDPATCAPGGKAPPQEWLVVDGASRGIANIAIFARDVSRVNDSAQPGEEPLVFDQEHCVFLTHVMAVPVGTPINIKNSDPVAHNTNIEGKFNQLIPAGEGVVSWKAQREEATPITVRCNLHPWMIAYILPRPNRYYAVTGKDGTFEIPNLPAGEEVEIQIWHESGAGSNGALVVESDAAKELKWDRKGRITVELKENEVREINIVIPASAFRSG